MPPQHNIAPTQPVPVVIVENGVRHFQLMRWGLMPAWVKDPRKFSAADQCPRRNRAGKTGLQERDQAAALPDPGRRLLRMAGFGKRKRPYFIHRRDGSPSALRRWRKPGSVQTARNSTRWRSSPHLRAPILPVLHHRVPVTIAPAISIAGWIAAPMRPRRRWRCSRDRRGRVRLARGLDPGQSRRQRRCAIDPAHYGGAARGGSAEAGEEGEPAQAGAGR